MKSDKQPMEDLPTKQVIRASISFGPQEEFSFNTLGKEVALELLDAGAKSLRVTHRDGWDHIEVDLGEQKEIDVKSKVYGYAPKLSFSKRMMLNLLKKVLAGPIVSYAGQIQEDGSIQVRDVQGVEVFTKIPFIGAAFPRAGFLYDSGKVQAEVEVLGGRRVEEADVRPELHTLVKSAIEGFKRLRQNPEQS